MRRSLVWIASVCLVALVGTLRAEDEVTMNRITEVEPGMTMLQVLGTLGKPTDEKKSTFYYKELGRVVFAGDEQPGPDSKVVKVEPDLNEDGYGPTN